MKTFTTSAPPSPSVAPEPPQAEPEEPQSTFGSLLSSLASGRIEPSLSGTPSRLPPALDQAVKQAIRECWNVDPGGLAARELVVEVDVIMRQDGTVVDAWATDRARYASDRIFRSAADRALRAVKNSACQPLPLAGSSVPFEEWREMTLNFDPSDMFF